VKITLPFIYAFNNSPENKKEILRNIIQNRKIEDFMILRDIIIETDSIKYTQDKAKEYVALAKNNLKVLENTEAGNLLNFLAEFALKRKK
jgi:geranylgeranyl pyrophosphate synthase